MQRTRILLVEDDPDDRELTRLALEESGILSELAVARDGAEALDYLFATGTYAGRDASDLPELVLLDLKLPRVDGLGVLRRMRAHARTKLLPVVILTASDEESDLIEGYRLGANSYVRKPMDFTQFIDAVHQLSRYWLVLNQRPPQPAAA
jgi:DNA-binding response OmpR family regulator